MGTAVPAFRGSQADIAAFLTRVAEAQPDCPPQFGRYAQFLARTSAIEHRHTVLADYSVNDPSAFTFFPPTWAIDPSPSTADRMAVYRTESVKLAEVAARRAIADAGLPATAITHLVLSTCTGFFAPGPDVMLMERLELGPQVQRSILGFMGCYAGLNGMRAADHIVRAEPDAVVLQVAVELCSLHFQTDADLESLVANMLFADGAAAAVYRSQPGRRELAPTVVRTASSVSNETRDQMGWAIGDHGFVMSLSDRVPRHLHDEAPRFVADLFSQSSLQAGPTNAAWAIHPGGKKILQALQKALGLETDDLQPSFDVLRDYGNMSSATILFVIDRVLRRWDPRRTGSMVAMSFGPGLTMEGALLHVA